MKISENQKEKNKKNNQSRRVEEKEEINPYERKRGDFVNGVTEGVSEMQKKKIWRERERDCVWARTYYYCCLRHLRVAVGKRIPPK